MHHLDLKLIILKKFSTQVDFATAVGEHESKVSQVIRGRKKLSKQEAAKWLEFLDCEADLLQVVTE